MTNTAPPLTDGEIFVIFMVTENQLDHYMRSYLDGDEKARNLKPKFDALGVDPAILWEKCIQYMHRMTDGQVNRDMIERMRQKETKQ